MKYPGMIVHSFGVSLAGMLFFSMIINTIWPISDRTKIKSDQSVLFLEIKIIKTESKTLNIT